MGRGEREETRGSGLSASQVPEHIPFCDSETSNQGKTERSGARVGKGEEGGTSGVGAERRRGEEVGWWKEGREVVLEGGGGERGSS